MSELPPLPKRADDVHKGKCGSVLVIAGSTGMTGAGALASRAALRSGAGLVTWAHPQSLSPIAEILCVEAITLSVPETLQKSLSVAAREHLLEASHEAQSVVMGPGLPAAGETGELMRLLIPEISAPLILDAGALRAIAHDISGISRRKAPTIITPHPGEMAELTGKFIGEIQADRQKAALEYAKRTESVVILKGAGSIITNGTKVCVNSTGNPGMATAGSGDVLSGVVSALLASGMNPYAAACLGTHLHGLAGDIALREKGVHGLIASDIIDCLPAAFLEYGGKK